VSMPLTVRHLLVMRRSRVRIPKAAPQVKADLDTPDRPFRSSWNESRNEGQLLGEPGVPARRARGRSARGRSPTRAASRSERVGPPRPPCPTATCVSACRSDCFVARSAGRESARRGTGPVSRCPLPAARSEREAARSARCVDHRIVSTRVDGQEHRGKAIERSGCGVSTVRRPPGRMMSRWSRSGPSPPGARPGTTFGWPLPAGTRAQHRRLRRLGGPLDRREHPSADHPSFGNDQALVRRSWVPWRGSQHGEHR